MHPVLQELMEIATVKLHEAFRAGHAPGSGRAWDPDAWEHEVRHFTRQVGRACLQLWAEERVRQAAEQATWCPCGRRRQVKKHKLVWWWSTFGRIGVVEPYLVCPQGHGADRPFQRLTGLRCRGKSKALHRVLTDFGAEKSFAQASRQLEEHDGVALHPRSVRQVVEEQARRAESWLAAHLQGAVSAYEQQTGVRQGEPWLIVESDGSMIRTGGLVLAPEGGQSPKRHLPKRQRQTQWREVRLTCVQRPGATQRRYGAILGSPLLRWGSRCGPWPCWRAGGRGHGSMGWAMGPPGSRSNWRRFSPAIAIFWIAIICGSISLRGRRPCRGTFPSRGRSGWNSSKPGLIRGTWTPSSGPVVP